MSILPTNLAKAKDLGLGADRIIDISHFYVGEIFIEFSDKNSEKEILMMVVVK